VLTSEEDAFPAGSPRPASNDLILRSWTIPGPVKRATHVRLRVLDNQCTGNTEFQGDQDNDPTNQSDCRLGSGGTVAPFGDLPDILAPRGGEVHAAELQAFQFVPSFSG
jgi:extracellular elastinolytic metalloproteinase